MTSDINSPGKKALEDLTNVDLLERVNLLEKKLQDTGQVLPPNAIMHNGQMFHSWDDVDADGNVHHHEKLAATNQQEAREKRMDWYHPQFGWVKDGYKLYRDRTAQDIMSDGSVAQMNPKIVKEISNAS